jgi:hypothetical protein
VHFLEWNAETNAQGRYQVISAINGSCKADPDVVREKLSVCVHPHALDWREAGENDSSCRFSVTRAMYERNKGSSECLSGLTVVQGQFDRVTVFVTDCVHSPSEVDDLMCLLCNLVLDLRLIPSVGALELIVAIQASAVERNQSLRSCQLPATAGWMDV